MTPTQRIGHGAAVDLERSRARLDTKILGFEVMEQDPEHGGLFSAWTGTLTRSTF